MRAVILAILAFFGILTVPPQTPKTLPQQTPVVKPNAQVSIGDKTYAVYWQKISHLTLIANFEKQRTSSLLMEECTYGANGGLYTTDDKPIGLFIADGLLLSSAKINATFNGYFVKKNNFALTREPPQEPVEFAIQSGPYVTTQTKLNIRNDTFARRILVGRSGSEWRFYAVTEKDNTFSGPLLSDLPSFLEELDIDEALNLDGGSASAFYSENGIRLGELTPIGSFFCGKHQQ